MARSSWRNYELAVHSKKKQTSKTKTKKNKDNMKARFVTFQKVWSPKLECRLRCPIDPFLRVTFRNEWCKLNHSSYVRRVWLAACSLCVCALFCVIMHFSVMLPTFRLGGFLLVTVGSKSGRVSLFSWEILSNVSPPNTSWNWLDSWTDPQKARTFFLVQSKNSGRRTL